MDNEYLTRLAKHYAKKAIGKPDPVWPFYSFEHSILPETLREYPEILSWAEDTIEHISLNESEELYQQSNDPVVQQGHSLKQQVQKQFRDLWKTKTSERFLIQVPDENFSPGGYSAFSNIIESLNFLGIPAFALDWNSNTKKALDDFQPTIFLITDHADFLARVDWDAIAAYKANHVLHIGLLAHLEEYGNTPLPGRLEWAKKHTVDFYFSFRNEEYFRSRESYKPFFEKGYEIFPIEFGANILHYYPVPNIKRDIAYIFIGSTNWTKGAQYNELAKFIVSHYKGFIDGFGWKHVENFSFNKNRDRYIYARGKVGLNFHLAEQLEWACEVNERTHQLAACGIPQLVNNAKLLPKLYSPDALCIASNGKEYTKYFEQLIRDESFAQSHALIAQREAFEKHTTFHRADQFMQRLSDFLRVK